MEKVSYVEAVELARKYFFMLLTVNEKENLNKPENSEYEEKVEKIFNEGILKEELEYLNSLPSWINWDKEKGYEVYKSFIGEEKTPLEIN
jgi:hypothetical protein